MMNDLILYQEMIRIGKRLYEKELIVANQGNFSIRLAENRILATPRGICKGDLLPEDLVVIDLNGQQLEGQQRVSSEIAMHLEVYRQRSDAKVVIHAHPPHCIALMLAGKQLDRPLLAENVFFIGKVPVAPFALPSTHQVADSIRPLIQETDCVLMDYHGSLTVGENLNDALFKLEVMEHTAKTYLLALQTGVVREIEPSELKKLMELRETAYRLNGRMIPFEIDSPEEDTILRGL